MGFHSSFRGSKPAPVVAAAVSSFTTTFPTTEAHLSQGGIFVIGDNSGLAATGPQTIGGTPGVTYGQAADGVDYIATLPGRFSTTKHYSECVIKRTVGYTAPDTQECELLTGFTIGSGVASGYELDLWFAGSNAQPVRWNNGATGSYDFGAVTTVSGSWPGNLVDGDVVRFSYDSTSGSPVFTISLNGTPIMVLTDTTAGKIMSGSPGFGSFARTGTGFDPAKYAIKTWSAGNA